MYLRSNPFTASNSLPMLENYSINCTLIQPNTHSETYFNQYAQSAASSAPYFNQNTQSAASSVPYFNQNAASRVPSFNQNAQSSSGSSISQSLCTVYENQDYNSYTPNLVNTNSQNLVNFVNYNQMSNMPENRFQNNVYSVTSTANNINNRSYDIPSQPLLHENQNSNSYPPNLQKFEKFNTS